MPPHPDEHTVLDINWDNLPKPKGKRRNFLHLLEVYIDNFIALIHTTDKEKIKRLTLCLLHAITDIFPAPSETGSKMGTPISTKKLLEEGAWETCKEILGWVLDDIAIKISLPQPKCDKILIELKAMRRSKIIPFNRLEIIRDKLNFTVISIQVGKPLLGQIDKEFL